jgi:hypothetical protein
MGTTYALEGSSSELSSHVGKKVEVTGTIDHNASASTGSTGATGSATGSTSGSTAGSTGSGSTMSSSSSMSSQQHLRVSSVRVVGGDCSASEK